MVWVGDMHQITTRLEPKSDSITCPVTNDIETVYLLANLACGLGRAVIVTGRAGTWVVGTVRAHGVVGTPFAHSRHTQHTRDGQVRGTKRDGKQKAGPTARRGRIVWSGHHAFTRPTVTPSVPEMGGPRIPNGMRERRLHCPREAVGLWVMVLVRTGNGQGPLGRTCQVLPHGGKVVSRGSKAVSRRPGLAPAACSQHLAGRAASCSCMDGRRQCSWQQCSRRHCSRRRRQ